MSYTYDEIRSQPETWAQTIATVPQQWAGISERVAFPPETHVLFVGCGTSFYLAQTAAHAFQETTGRAAAAIPGSEVFLSPASTVPRGVPIVAFVISRSGTTSEAILAARHLNTLPDVQTVGLTCSPGTELAQATRHAIELLHVEERSVVMTRSFTNMLIALQLVAAAVAGNVGLQAELAGLPALLRPQLDEMEAFARDLGRRGDIRRVIYLGLGPNFGLAAEATLKLKEMTQVECEPYNPLEFRHGAISTVRDDTAVVFIAGERERAYVPDAEEDVKRHGALVATVAPYPSDHAAASIVLPNGLSDIARCALYLPPLQLLAHERALLLGLDPDAPRNLGHVVVLDAR